MIRSLNSMHASKKTKQKQQQCSEYIEPKLSTREARADLNILVNKVKKKSQCFRSITFRGKFGKSKYLFPQSQA